jgi:hypothetical protein
MAGWWAAAALHAKLSVGFSVLTPEETRMLTIPDLISHRSSLIRFKTESADTWHAPALC